MQACGGDDGLRQVFVGGVIGLGIGDAVGRRGFLGDGGRPRKRSVAGWEAGVGIGRYSGRASGIQGTGDGGRQTLRGLGVAGHQAFGIGDAGQVVKRALVAVAGHQIRQSGTGGFGLDVVGAPRVGWIS